MPKLPAVEIDIQEVAREMLVQLGIETNSPGFTTEELAEAWDVKPVTARKRVAKLKAQGKIAEGLRACRKTNGHIYYAPVYLLKKEQE